MSEDLTRRFELARRSGDEAALAHLFALAAERETDLRAEAFMLTQAHTLALSAGLAEAAGWRARLVLLGAEDAVG